MTNALSELVNILTLEKIEEDLYLGVGSKNDGADATYGGHLLDKPRRPQLRPLNRRGIHSLHAYFLSGEYRANPLLILWNVCETVVRFVPVKSLRCRRIKNY